MFSMSLRVLTRKTKIQLISSEGDVCTLLFAQRRTQQACRLFLDFLKEHKALSRRELSRFAWDLQAGKVKPGFRYSRTQFYAQVRKVLMTLGLIGIEDRFDQKAEFDLQFSIVRQKYVPVRQPITKRPPDGLNLVRLTWVICDKWNREFLYHANGGENHNVRGEQD
jgi:hypothetical protein